MIMGLQQGQGTAELLKALLLIHVFSIKKDVWSFLLVYTNRSPCKLV
jgi:hypothetical protein